MKKEKFITIRLKTKEQMENLYVEKYHGHEVFLTSDGYSKSYKTKYLGKMYKAFNSTNDKQRFYTIVGDSNIPWFPSKEHCIIIDNFNLSEDLFKI